MLKRQLYAAVVLMLAAPGMADTIGSAYKICSAMTHTGAVAILLRGAT